ncbi:MAG: ACT domain-containing protein [Leptolyngbya sp. RL_3_1]|nr:ACT domain-containing protein [Leptolyngbya sp. RL_3_1]
MIGETNLATLLRQMTPHLHPATFVFCTLPPEILKTLTIQPRCTFQEAEGMTLLVTQAEAEAQNWPYTYPCRQITLEIHSSLEAVGFLAAITTALAAEGISVNPVSAYYHDHLFVPVDQAERRSPASKPSLPPINPPCCRKTGDAGVPTAVEDFHSAGWLSVTLAMANP